MALTTEGLSEGRRRPLALANPELGGALVFLFAVRWGAWVIALVTVLAGDGRPEVDQYEPWLLSLTAVQSLVATLYVPLLRPRLHRGREASASDLLALGLADVAVVLTVVHLSGGWQSPYYQYTLTSLVVPAFLLNVWQAAALAVAFTGAYLGVLSTAGAGTSAGWVDDSLAAIIISPVLVVAVVQYLSWLSQRLAQQRGRAQQALEENIRLQRDREALIAQEERSRIAREIHDGIAQSIYILSLNLEKAADIAGDDPRLGERLGRLVGLAKETLLEVRHYIFDLKPLLAGDAGLAGTIQAQIREFTTVSGLPVRWTVEGEERKVSVAVAGSLYRIAQEALANVYRHAGASAIDLTLSFGDHVLALAVQDDGCGFDTASVLPTGRGLQNMRQRVAELGGSLEIVSAPGGGTTVRAELPAE